MLCYCLPIQKSKPFPFLSTASRYTIHLSSKFDQLLASKPNESVWTHVGDQLLWNLSNPQPAGQRESIVVSLRHLRENETIFMGVRATDDSDNSGDLSNVVTVSRALELAVPIEHAPPGHGVPFYLKLLLPPVFMLIIFLCLILVLAWTRRNRKLDCDDDQEAEMAASIFSLDLTTMNYRSEGQYRQRHLEDVETWSRDSLGSSRESLNMPR